MPLPFSVSSDVLALNPQLREENDRPTVSPSKYKNVRAEAKGMTFQSGHEAAVVSNLIMLEERKQIFALRLQVRFPLAGETVYVADACYCELRDGVLSVVVADAKGMKTKEYKIKRKLFRERYGVNILEV